MRYGTKVKQNRSSQPQPKRHQDVGIVSAGDGVVAVGFPDHGMSKDRCLIPLRAITEENVFGSALEESFLR